MNWNLNGVDHNLSFLFLEDSADSDDDFTTLIRKNREGYAEDDAESCSCEKSDGHDLLSEDIEDRNGGNRLNDLVGVSCWRNCGHMGMSPYVVEEGEEVSKINETNTEEMVDRIFWETCMAVGYPLT